MRLNEIEKKFVTCFVSNYIWFIIFLLFIINHSIAKTAEEQQHRNNRPKAKIIYRSAKINSISIPSSTLSLPLSPSSSSSSSKQWTILFGIAFLALISVICGAFFCWLFFLITRIYYCHYQPQPESNSRIRFRSSNQFAKSQGNIGSSWINFGSFAVTASAAASSAASSPQSSKKGKNNNKKNCSKSQSFIISSPSSLSNASRKADSNLNAQSRTDFKAAKKRISPNVDSRYMSTQSKSGDPDCGTKSADLQNRQTSTPISQTTMTTKMIALSSPSSPASSPASSSYASSAQKTGAFTTLSAVTNRIVSTLPASKHQSKIDEKSHAQNRSIVSEAKRVEEERISSANCSSVMMMIEPRSNVNGVFDSSAGSSANRNINMRNRNSQILPKFTINRNLSSSSNLSSVFADNNNNKPPSTTLLSSGKKSKLYQTISSPVTFDYDK